MKIGVIGQGFVGGAYSDALEKQGCELVRYSLEAQYKGNKEKIKDCDTVFIAVPTPTIEREFVTTVIEEAIVLTKPGAVVVVKSTVIPGTTRKLAKSFPDRIIMHAPEFLRERFAKQEVENPDRQIIGITNPTHAEYAHKVIHLLPKAKFELICTAEEAELIKYSHNVHGYVQIVLANLFYDYALKIGASWSPIQSAVMADPWMAGGFWNPMHQDGRGAAGSCFIKDYEAFRQSFMKDVEDELGGEMLTSILRKNLELLTQTNKGLTQITGVYGDRPKI